MRLPRPRIPLKVRVEVAARQLVEIGASERPESDLLIRNAIAIKPLGRRLAALLGILFGANAVRAELHHRPALVNRKKVFRRGVHVDYDPPANDSAHLVYLLDEDHDVETRVRGVGAQHSDLGLRRKNKRIEKRLAAGLKVGQRVTWAGFRGKIVHVATGRKLRSANRWPPKGSRKIAGRKKR